MPRANAFFEGGGVKGIAFAGALDVLESAGWEWEATAGSSVGAVVAALVAAGFRAGELRDALENRIGAARLRDKFGFGFIPWLGKYLNLLHYKGMYAGRKFHRTLGELLAEKAGTDEDVTFGHELFCRNPKLADDDATKFRLRVITVDISTRRMLVLPQDASHLGIEPSELSVADAVRMSAGLPIYFRPWTHRNAKTGQDHILLDGGLVCNLPMHLFFPPEVPAQPLVTLGFVLQEPWQNTVHYTQPRSIEGFMTAVAETVSGAGDEDYIARYAPHILAIPTGEAEITDFDITRREREELYQAGAKAAESFLETWRP